MSVLRIARLDERGRWLRWRHLIAMTSARISAPIADTLFPVVLDWGLQRSSHGLFSVPTPWAARYFSRSLEFDCTVARIATDMPDWVLYAPEDSQTGHRIWHIHRFALGAGDWSGLLLPVVENTVFQEAQQLNAVDFRFREAQVYAAYREAMERGRPRMRNYVLLDSPARIDAYFLGFIELFESIALHGLQRRRAMRQKAATQPPATTRSKASWLRWFNRWSECDIGIAVGAQGTLHRLPGGQHRMAVAHVLNIGTVPVTARLIHADWVETQVTRYQQPPATAISTGFDKLREAATSPPEGSNN